MSYLNVFLSYYSNLSQPNRESTGAPIGSAHPSPICMDAPCNHGRVCIRVHDRFFFFSFHFPIQPDTIWYGPKRAETGLESIPYGPKKVLKKKGKKSCQNTTFWHPNFKEKTLNSSQTLNFVTLLSTIALKLVYVYHYMKKYA